MNDRIRLDRFLAEAEIGSRAEVKKFVRAGRIQVNHETVKQGERKIDPEADEILVDGKPVRQVILPVIMLNKPAGVVSATKDAHDQTVLDLIRESWADRLFPVGRLDKDTEGLLLLTDDGKLSHELLSPKKHVTKTYFAVVSGEPDPELSRRFREGLEIGEKRKTLPAGLLFLRGDGEVLFALKEDREPGLFSDREAEQGKVLPGKRSLSQADFERCREGECCVLISITEGKFHQVKRMFEAVGREVRFLKRVAMGDLELDPSLVPGQYRPLTGEEVKLLKKSPPSLERSSDESVELEEPAKEVPAI